MTLIYSIILLLTFVSCCKSYKTGISPDVRIVINKGINEYIYSEGLKQLPKYYDLIIAHTSFLIDKDKIEDDRLCAINVKNGKVEWYFPKNTDIHCGYSFGGTSYQYRNNIIFKYIKDDSDKKSHNLACINIDTGEILWERSEIINNYHSYADVHGWNNFVYFTENSNKIYRFNIETKDVSLVYTANDAEICHFKIDNNYLLFFEDRRIILSDDYMIATL